MMDDPRPFRSLSRDERRERIVWSARAAFVERGVDESSMDDVAARAGTTKPTVYAHFGSKEELLAAVHEAVRRSFVDQLGDLDGDPILPVEAVARFCGRYLELSSTSEALGYQRLTVAMASQHPAAGAAAYDALYAQAVRALEAYLRARELTPRPSRDAELLMDATVAGPMLRLLYGAAEPSAARAEGVDGESRVDAAKIREAVERIGSPWGKRPAG